MHIENYIRLPYGDVMEVAPHVKRVLAANPKPLTFRGTNTYLIGDERLAIVDPGPAIEAHFDSVIQASKGQPIDYICVTHSHVDHSGGAQELARRTGAKVMGFGGLFPLTPSNCIEEDYDLNFKPEHILKDGDTIEFGGFTLKAIHTPGHFPNHLCYSLEGTNILFSGDHVLGWASTVVAAPVGIMSDYLSSLDKLAQRDDQLYLPGHGPVIANPKETLRKLIDHRHEREHQVVACLSEGLTKVEDIVHRLYSGIDEGLFVPACKSVEAHILHLEACGKLSNTNKEALA